MHRFGEGVRSLAVNALREIQQDGTIAFDGYCISEKPSRDVEGGSPVVSCVCARTYGLLFLPFWLNRALVHTYGSGYGSIRTSLSVEDESAWQLALELVSFIVRGGSMIAITYAVKRHYRCPKCDAIPMGSGSNLGPGAFGRQWGGVALNPSVCPSCGARLS
jgi:hypothetical protein